MKNLTTIGRILFALPFGIIGLNHFLMIDIFTGMLTSFVPGGAYTVLFSGTLLIAASICLIINKFVKLTCIIIAIMLGLFILTIHVPSLFDKAKAGFAMIELLKDTGLLGGALLIAGIYKEKESN